MAFEYLKIENLSLSNMDFLKDIAEVRRKVCRTGTGWVCLM